MAKQEKVTEKKAPAKRGRKPKTVKEDKFTNLEQKLLEDREMFFDLISSIRKRLVLIENTQFIFNCVILITIIILFLILCSK